MRIIGLIVLLVAIHFAMGATQFGYDVLALDRHVSTNIIEYTPLAQRLSLDALDAQKAAEITASGNFVQQAFNFVGTIGDRAWGLATFDYPFIRVLQEDEGIWQNLAQLLRIFTSFATVAIGGRLMYIIFESGLLNSTGGQVLLGVGALGAGVTGIAGIFN